ncbi:MAG: hypothetical protein J6128_00365 [Clostridia bacterium]|nr:hypothetical protein [Clostridia bacterium]
MIVYKNRQDDPKNLRRYVNTCEKKFDAKLEDAVDRVLAKKGIRIIALSGPSCSGKTTMSKKLISRFRDLGRPVIVVSLDNFFRPRRVLATIKDNHGNPCPDFDSVNAIDLEAMRKAFDDLFNGREATIPDYDFIAGEAVGSSTVTAREDDTIIVEGIQAVYPEVVSMIPSDESGSIFLSVERKIRIFGEVFDGREIRFLRRLVRDYKFRAAEPDYSYSLWKGVCDNEDVNILPYYKSSDIIVDTLMPYEPGVIKDDLDEILDRVDRNGPNRDHADYLREVFSAVEPVPDEMLPEGSIYREFIGP